MLLQFSIPAWAGQYLWTLAFAFLGFAVIAYRSSLKPHENTAWPSYVTMYPLTILLAVAFVAGVLRLIAGSDIVSFRLIAMPIGFLVGYNGNPIAQRPLAFISKFWKLA